ncbi:dermonecrotic toxin domain-containing protein [Pseudomonas laurentiana]
MAIDIEHYEQGLAALTEARQLMAMFRRQLEAFPDVHGAARDAAGQYLLQHTAEALNPDRVFWRQFSVQSYRKTDGRGWGQYRFVKRTMTFTDLWVRRFPHDVIHTPQLNDFVQDDERPIALAPAKVDADLWALDFASVMHDQARQYWLAHSYNLLQLLKIRFTAHVEQALKDSKITPGDRDWLRTTVAEATLAFRCFTPKGAAKVLALHGPDGRVVVYRPNSTPHVQAYANAQALAHLALGEASSEGRDLFAEQREWVKAEVEASLAVLVSNGDLREQLWRDRLDMALQLVALPALFSGPAMLLMLLLTVAQLGLDTYDYFTARSAAQKTQALQAAFGDVLILAFAVIFETVGRKALTTALRPHEALPVQGWVAAEDADEEWQSLASHSPAPGALQADGLLAGVRLADDGALWIELQGKAVRVRYNTEIQHLVLTHESAPFGLVPQMPVRLGEDGAWQLLAPGGKRAALATRFWDVYLTPGDALARELSQGVEQEQSELLAQAHVPSMEDTARVAKDEYGYHCVVEDGVRHYSFRQGGDLHNDLVMEYTREQSELNSWLRHGMGGVRSTSHGELVHVTEHLLDSLQRLPKSNATYLWRAGSAARGTGGALYRTQQIMAGDVLVGADFTSFTESPYVVRDFLLPHADSLFDDDAIVYELTLGKQTAGVPIAPLSLNPLEAEVLFAPGNFFRVESIDHITGETYRFTRVRLCEYLPSGSEMLLEMRTGKPFDLRAYGARVANAELVERIFPAPWWH